MRHHGFSCSSLYTVTPEQAQGNLLIDDRGIRVTERLAGEIGLSDIEKLVIGVVLVRGSDAFNPGVRPFRKHIQQEERSERVAGAHLLGPRVREEARKIDEPIRLHKDV